MHDDEQGKGLRRAARFLQGMSAAMMLICQIAILSTQFRDGRERGRAFA